MIDLLQTIVKIQAPFNMVVLIMLIIFGSWMICEIAKQIRIFACHRQELAFKREMIDRGMDGQEIELVMNTSSPACRDAEVNQSIVAGRQG